MPINKCTVSLSFILSFQILFLLGLAKSLPTPLPSHFSNFSNAHIYSACSRLPYKAACETMLSSTLSSPPQTPVELFDHSVKFIIDHAYSARSLAYNLSLYYGKTQSHLVGGMNDCLELLDDTLDQLDNVANHKQTPSTTDDVQTWLSAACTNQQTCLESLENYKVKVEKDEMDSTIQNLNHFISNTLTLYVSTKPIKRSGHRRLLLSDGFPSWVSMKERKLLHGSVGDEIEANAVVAKDGSGTHKSIGEALALVASLAGGGGGRTVIHVAAGTYHENIKIPTKQKNVMLVGDGKGKTIIVGDRSNEGGWTTFQSATVGKNSLLLGKIAPTTFQQKNKNSTQTINKK